MNRLKSKRLITIVVALALVGGGTVAIAAANGSSASGNGFLAAVARHLGISTQKLQDATKAAAIDQVNADLKAGRITKAEADALKARINSGDFPGLGGPRFFGGFGGPRFFGGFGHFHGPFGGDLSAAADYLGLTPAQLRTKLFNGQSLAQVAKAQNKSVDGLKQALLDSAKKRLDQAVSDGMLTRAQADEELSELKSRIDDIVNDTFRGPPGLRGFRFHDGPPRGAAFWGASA